MMFSKRDLRVDNARELIEFLPIVIFIALVAPLLIVAYKLGFVMDKLGWLRRQT